MMMLMVLVMVTTAVLSSVRPSDRPPPSARPSDRPTARTFATSDRPIVLRPPPDLPSDRPIGTVGKLLTSSIVLLSCVHLLTDLFFLQQHGCDRDREIVKGNYVYTYIYKYIPPALWASGGIDVAWIKITPLHTLSLGLRSGGPGPLGSEHCLHSKP